MYAEVRPVSLTIDLNCPSASRIGASAGSVAQAFARARPGMAAKLAYSLARAGRPDVHRPCRGSGERQMRVLPEAGIAEAERCLAADKAGRRSRVRPYRRSVSLPVLSMILGALIGGSYAAFMLQRPGWLMYALCAVGGACAGWLLIAIPHVTWLVLRRRWVRLALRLAEHRLDDLVSGALDALHEAAESGQSAERETAHDLAVAHCLRSDYEATAQALGRLGQDARSAPETNVLLVALAKTQRWQDLAEVLRSLDRPGEVGDTALATVAASAPHGNLLDALWAHARGRDCAVALNNLGVRFLQAGDLMRADEAFTQTVELRPSSALGHGNLGVLAYRREDYGLAVTEMACAASLEPGDATLLCNLGAGLCQAGDPRLARRWLNRARVVAPGSPDVLVTLGNAYALQGRYEEALETENEAARTAEIPAAHHNAALLLAARRHLAAALEQQRSAFELAPDDPDVLNNLGCLLWLRGRYVEARPHFARAAEARYHETARGNLVRAELAAGRLQPARDLILTTSYADEERDFDRGLVHLLAAMQQELRDGSPPTPQAAHELSEASVYFQKVVEYGRGPLTESHINLGIVDYVHGDYENAAAAFAAAAAYAPESLELEYPIGVCYLTAAGRLLGPESRSDERPSGSVLDLMNRARPHLEKALAAQDVADAAHLNLGVVHYVLGNYEKAIETLRPIARPDSPWEIQNVMAIAQARRARQLQVSIQSDPLLRAVKKGYIRAQIGKLLSAAIHSFGHVLRHEPHNAVAHANIGLAHYLRNRGDDVEAALHHWQRMRQTGGEWGERIFERFSIAMSSDGADRLNFQDIEVTFQPLPVHDWVTCPAPRMAGLQYVVRELQDDRPPEFEPRHRLVRRALACRDRVARLRVVLRRLA